MSDEKNKIIQKLFSLQEKLIGSKWVQSKKKALETVVEMKKRNLKLTEEEARKEAFEQARKIRNQRFK